MVEELNITKKHLCLLLYDMKLKKRDPFVVAEKQSVIYRNVTAFV